MNGIAGERRTFSHRQIGNQPISKQFESYGTPNATWNGLTSQSLMLHRMSASTGGCHSGTQRLSNGGVSELALVPAMVTMVTLVWVHTSVSSPIILSDK